MYLYHGFGTHKPDVCAARSHRRHYFVCAARIRKRHVEIFFLEISEIVGKIHRRIEDTVRNLAEPYFRFAAALAVTARHAYEAEHSRGE